MSGALEPFRSPAFRFLFVGRFVSYLGTAIAPVAVAFAVLDLGGSASDLGLVLAARSVPMIVFVLVGGVIADRLPRQFVLVASNGLSAVTQAAATDSAASAAKMRADRRLGFIKTLYDLKIPFLAGTDAPAGQDLVPGASLHRELQLFVRAGLTPGEALHSATARSMWRTVMG